MRLERGLVVLAITCATGWSSLAADSSNRLQHRRQAHTHFAGEIPVNAMNQGVQDRGVQAVVDGGNRFAFDLYQRLRKSDGNLFFSPASISIALAMAYAGSEGTTEAEMAKTLHLDMPKSKVDSAMHTLLAAWQESEKTDRFRLHVANRLWAQEGYHFLPEYLEITRTDYGAELGRLDFSAQTEQARQAINTWVEDHTEKKITNLIASARVIQDAKLVLTNAVYFNGTWIEPFNKHRTRDEDFHASADRTIKAPFMQNRAHFRYGTAEGFQILQLGYRPGTLSMFVLLPETVDGLAAVESKLSEENLRTWTSGLGSQEVIVALPKFKTTAEFQLRDVLQSLGMASAFDPKTADFSGMNGNRDLYISTVIHKAFVDVNEEGTEAAAATAIGIRAAAARVQPQNPPVFRADHPFVFLIRDDRNGAILFLGRVVDPTK